MRPATAVRVSTGPRRPVRGDDISAQPFLSLRGRGLRLTLLAAIIAYGGLLRIDAISSKYDAVPSPAWWRSVQQARAGTSILRPARMTWPRSEMYAHRDAQPSQYRSDPYTYLQYAKAMSSFYAAHRREPLFPFATKVALWLFDGQDVAVSFASAFFSVLAVLGTYLVGATAVGPWAGLIAALGFAVDYDAVSWSTDGWRDDAFTATVVFFAWLLVRYWQHPSRRAALWLGVAGGFACLTRISALSFVVPVVVIIAAGAPVPWPQRARDATATALVVGILLGPFLVNCWRAFGDPLYAINVHVDIERLAEGDDISDKQTVGAYLVSKFSAEPFGTLDTLVIGMTQYPFGNKWGGFAPWLPSVWHWLPRISLVGLVLLAASSEGRLLLLVLAASLVPFAATWKLGNDWRFTEHAYPFFLAAIGTVFAAVVAAGRPSFWRTWRRPVLTLRTVTYWTCVAAGVLGAWWAIDYALPMRVIDEALGTGQAVTIATGGRDAAFFPRSDWLAAQADGSLTFRLSQGPAAHVHVPLPAVQDYDATVRVDPSPSPTATGPGLQLSIVVNGQRVAAHPVVWDPVRVGSYPFHIPAALARPDVNDVTLVLTGAPSSHLRLWYIRIRPPGA